jgi:TonB family protein
MTFALNGSTPAVLLSLVLHVAAFVGVGLNRLPRTVGAEAPVEVTIESELPPPKEEVPEPEAPAPALEPVKMAAHHEAVAVRAVAATNPTPNPEPTPPAEAPHALVGDDALPHFAIATSTSTGGSATLAKTSGTATSFEGTPNEDAPYAEGAVDVPARAARKVSPQYPFEARSSGIEASVKLEIVLSARGVRQSVMALSHVGHGLEQEAIAALRRTPFSPAMKQGRAVPVRMIWIVEFRLQ